MSRGRSPFAFSIFFPALLFSSIAIGHQASNTYLILEVTNRQIAGRWEIALKDLLHAQGEERVVMAMTNTVPLDAATEIANANALSKLKIKLDGSPVALKPVEYSTEMFPDGLFAVVYLQGETTSDPKILQVEYRLFFDVDPSHRGMIAVLNGTNKTSAVFDPGHSVQQFELRKSTAAENLFQFVRLGIFHIGTGYDHVLFLLALLFPSVLRWQNGKWEISTSFRAAFVNVLKVVTAFTLAHSVTLSLAAFKLVHLNSRIVESAIAISVALAALNNIFGVLPHFGWVIAFAFGLIHGFGFANVLGELGLERGSLAWPLVGFNAGVELGQLAIVSLFLPIAFQIRATRFYRVGILKFGSLIIVAFAGVWAWERIFDMNFDNLVKNFLR
jgi:hypothetical protein